MNGRLVMRASAVVAGVVLSRCTAFDAFDALLLACVVTTGILGWYLMKVEPTIVGGRDS